MRDLLHGYYKEGSNMDGVKLLDDDFIKKVIAERHGVTPEEIDLEWMGYNCYKVRINALKKIKNIEIDIVFGEEK